jgi:hypothetical protein
MKHGMNTPPENKRPQPPPPPPPKKSENEELIKIYHCIEVLSRELLTLTRLTGEENLKTNSRIKELEQRVEKLESLVHSQGS